MKLARSIGIVILFVLGCEYLPYPLNAILMLLAFVLIILGIFSVIMDAYRRTSQRFWNALERPEKPDDPTADSDYLPYVTTRYRRIK